MGTPLSAAEIESCGIVLIRSSLELLLGGDTEAILPHYHNRPIGTKNKFYVLCSRVNCFDLPRRSASRLIPDEIHYSREGRGTTLPNF